MKRFVALLFFCAGLALAQADYIVIHEAALSATTTALTVQAPASNAARVVRFQSVLLYCSAACDITMERGGTAATTTTLTPTPLNGVTAAAKTTAWSASNAGTGTTIGKWTVAAGQTLPISLSQMSLSGAGTTKNITFRVASMTGTARITVQFREEL